MECHPAKETGGQSRHAARSPIPREYLGNNSWQSLVEGCFGIACCRGGGSEHAQTEKALRHRNAGSGRCACPEMVKEQGQIGRVPPAFAAEGVSPLVSAPHL